MDTAWIQVFILTLAECVAPAGKTVCQERVVRMEFIDRAACEQAMEQMLWLAEGASDVIIDRENTRCAASAVERPIFASLEDVQKQVSDAAGWEAPRTGQPVADATGQAHRERLDGMRTCEESRGVTPCKVGEIIIEGATERRTEVWRSNP